EYIPSFVRRKNGEEPITYDIEACEEYLSETYGITVYQEQVMLLSQKLASFSKGDADVLRKAMGKKQKDVLDKMKSKFIDQAVANGHPADTLEKIWGDWEAFASYAFNKSHSTCYAWIGYQTAYLKAHYPAEYMAAVLSNNMNDIKQVSFFMEECRRMGLKVLSPDVNESFYKFTVNDQGAVRFGMGAVKGVGAGAVETIVQNRIKEGKYKSIFDLDKRIDLRAANKRALENLAYAGGFDCFTDTHRAQYFHHEGDGITFLEKAIRYGSKFQENENSAQVSLFGDAAEVQIPEPTVPPCEEWSTMEKLAQEKEVVGIYISGHPLDDFRYEMRYFCNGSLDMIKNLDQHINKIITLGGIITSVEHKVSKNGKGFAFFNLEGYEESQEFRIFGEEYLKFRHYLIPNNFTYMKVLIREGFENRETGKRGEPRMQYQVVQYLQDVLPQFAKKLIIHMNIMELHQNLIGELKEIFGKHKGDHYLQFEIMELEKVIHQPLPLVAEEVEEEVLLADDEELQTVALDTPPKEMYKVLTHLSLPSRKMKIKISSELLDALEQRKVDFKLN
ncbi:MAG: DNA polymerase III subunit alpha, partial [Flavobacterium sp.]